MGSHLIDTNCISYYFAANLTPGGLEFMDEVINRIPNISVITKIELLSWKTLLPEETAIKTFIAECNIYNITNGIIDQCVKIRRDLKIKTPDAIIAATAMINNFELITANETDFAKIPGLKIINPTKL